MKKIAALIVAALFTLAIIFAVFTTASHQSSKSGSSYAAIVPIPPPANRKDGKKQIN
jgi:hypothetical protein